MSKDIYLTKEKLEETEKELENLKKVERPKVIAKIKEARSLGDLSENAEYHAAREEQSFIEGKIEELEYMLKNVQVIDSNKCKRGNAIDIGCRVVCSIDGGKQEFMIVGSAEVDIEKGRISNESPIGQALLGKKVGDTIEVEVPDGKINYKILEIC